MSRRARWQGRVGSAAARPRRRGWRRGGTLVEFGMLAALYFTMLFGVIEFTWLGITRQSLLNGAAKGARLGSVGKPLADIRKEVRSGSGISVADGSIAIQYCSTDDGTGTWLDAGDDFATGSPPLANSVPFGRPIRVRIAGWQHRLIMGSLFSWLAGASGGQVRISAGAMTRRE